MIRSVLGSRAAMGYVLGRGAGAAAAAWYLAGGVSAANCVAAYQPKGAASLAASYVNLANPGTYNAAPGVAPTFDTATGWTFNGSTQYLTTGLVPGATSWSVLCRFSDAGTVAAFQGLLGAYNTISGTIRRFILYQRHSTSNYGVGNDGTLTAAGTISSGVLGFAGANGYYNGSAMSGSVSPNSTTAISSIFIGAWHTEGTAPGAYFPGKIQAAAIYNVTLSAATVAAISAAMAAL